MALTLANLDKNSTFIDSDTTYEGAAIEWVVAGHNIDGDNITTLFIKKPISGFAYDAAEPGNVIERRRNYGNNQYDVSNILQYLNATGEAGKWFTKQHSADQSPNSSAVVRGNIYSEYPGFLNGFSEDLLNAMQFVTKLGASRKVHLPGYNEVGGYNYDGISSVRKGLYDPGETYNCTGWSYAIANTSNSGYLILRTIGEGATDETYKYATVAAVRYNQSTSRLESESYNACYGTNYYIPVVIYVKSDTPVIYNNSTRKYYAKFDKAPTVTIDSNLGQHKTAFDFSFTVNDEESDIVSVNAYVDNTTGTAFYSNNNVTLNTPITTAIPTATYDALNYGNHKIIIVASDGQKTTTVESSFEKFDIAPSITVDSSFGQKKYTFGFVFRVVDADDTSSNVTVELEGTQLYSDIVALDTDITVNIPTNVFEALSIGQHTITITASDGIKTGTATPTFQRIEISAPVITCEDAGNVLNGFTTYYQVYDEDGGTVDVNIKLDGATISSATDVSQQVDIPITISDAQVTGLSYGAHSILITATDSDNYTSTRTINFNKKSTPYVAIVNPTIGDVTAPFDIVVNYNSPDGDEVTVKAVIDGTIEV